MADIIQERVCAEVDGEIVLFLIGVRLNRIWKFWKFLPVLRAMPRMLQELVAHPELGLLSARSCLGLRDLSFVQYWKSAAHLQAYALGNEHLPAWRAFNRSIGTNGDLGIWHETFIVPAGNLESIYINMPRYGLGLAGTLHSAKDDRATAAKRLKPSRSADPGGGGQA